MSSVSSGAGVPASRASYLVVCIHGIRGGPSDFITLKDFLSSRADNREEDGANSGGRLEGLAAAAVALETTAAHDDDDYIANRESSPAGQEKESNEHGLTCNCELVSRHVMFLACKTAENHTLEGIETLGTIIENEMRAAVLAHPSLEYVSVVGFSLGGLIARYVLRGLYNDQDKTVVGLQPLDFITAATPHLGLRAYSSVWRRLERLRHKVTELFCKQTGKELLLADGEEEGGKDVTPSSSSSAGASRRSLLFRLTDDEFVKPLRCFQRRLLYANARSDLLVPFATAAIDHEAEVIYPDRRTLWKPFYPASPNASRAPSGDRPNCHRSDSGNDISTTCSSFRSGSSCSSLGSGGSSSSGSLGSGGSSSSGSLGSSVSRGSSNVGSGSRSGSVGSGSVGSGSVGSGSAGSGSAGNVCTELRRGNVYECLKVSRQVMRKSLVRGQVEFVRVVHSPTSSFTSSRADTRHQTTLVRRNTSPGRILSFFPSSSSDPSVNSASVDVATATTTITTTTSSTISSTTSTTRAAVGTTTTTSSAGSGGVWLEENNSESNACGGLVDGSEDFNASWSTSTSDGNGGGEVMACEEQIMCDRLNSLGWTKVVLDFNVWLPIAHHILFALARTRFEKWLTSGGEPVMQHLGEVLLEGIEKTKDRRQ
eukprot:GHVS01094471.1.p1 GENE.GHVS01094471.1~~GHVS01094471.1.p1  ORF type:complete len:654 (+),score=183.63 GHVS01094471.1:355-2316(+)